MLKEEGEEGRTEDPRLTPKTKHGVRTQRQWAAFACCQKARSEDTQQQTKEQGQINNNQIRRKARRKTNSFADVDRERRESVMSQRT